MTTTKKTNPAPLAAHAAKDITPTMTTFSDWLTTQTGYKVDPMSVQLGSALRGAWQLEQRAEKEAAPKATKTAVKPVAKAAPKVAAKPATVKAAPKPRAKAGATIATAEGVVIAEQRHVEVA